MKILSNSTNYTRKQILEMVKFVKPPGVHNFNLRIKNSTYGVLRGGSWQHGTGYKGSTTPQVNVSISKDESDFPIIHDIGKPYLRSLLLSRDEALIHILAHELRHQWQYDHKGKRGKVYGGKRGLSSERDADAYAIRMTRAWRRKERERRQREWLEI